MGRDERWRENRSWDFDREAREMRARPDYGQSDTSRGYGVGDYRDYRDYRGDRDDRGERPGGRYDEGYRAEQEGRDQDARAWRPFGATGPTAYYGSGGYPPAASPWRGEARPDERYAPRYEPRYTPNPREGRGEEPRSWVDKAADTVASWFGDDDARRRHEWDEMRAGHRGRGPKGYRRSDERIREDVNDRLTEDPYLDASDIEVTVAEADVTLSGHVTSREDKRRAERLTEEVPGVRDVQNNIRLRRDDDAETPVSRAQGNF